MGEPKVQTGTTIEAPKVVLVPITEVKIGPRARQDPGDLESLKESISRLGLLHPIIMTPAKELVCGGRRLAACSALGYESIPALIAVDLQDVRASTEAEAAENICRKSLNPVETVALGRRLEELYKPAAQQRKGGRPSKTAGKLPAVSAGDTRDVVGALVGLSGSTYEHAKEVVLAAEDNQVHYGDLVAMMIRTGKIAGAYAELQRRQAPRAPKARRPEVVQLIRSIRGALLRRRGRRNIILIRRLVDRLHMRLTQASDLPMTIWSLRDLLRKLREESQSPGGKRKRSKPVRRKPQARQSEGGAGQ